MTQRTVLVVEDDREIRESLADALADEGYAVVLASNGREGLEMLPTIRGRFAVVLDILMPVMNGREFYEAMRRDPRFARVPVLVSTSDPSRAPSGTLIMRKPVPLPALMSAVRSFFEAPDPQGDDSGGEVQPVAPGRKSDDQGARPQLRSSRHPGAAPSAL
jgi:CheY-like chemotaxis protein